MKLRQFFISLGLLAMPLFASFALPAAAEGVKTISVSPTHEYIDLEPGEEYIGTFKVFNDGDTDFYYTISVSPYQVSDYNYQVVSNTANAFTEIVNWISFSRTRGFLAAGESAEITYVVNVPVDAHGGGQYAILSAAFVDENEKATVKVAGSVGEIIYARVSGDITVDGHILKNRIIGFSFNPPLSAITTVNNTGNVDNHLESILTVKNFFTDSVIYTTEKNPTDSVVLPNTTRDVTIAWNESPRLGVYKVNLASSYLEESQNIEKVVVLCPIWLLLIVLIFIIVVIVRIAMKIRSRTKKKRIRASKFSI